MFTRDGLPMLFVLGLIAISYLSFLSVIFS
jgi:hypothetical protein